MMMMMIIMVMVVVEVVVLQKKEGLPGIEDTTADPLRWFYSNIIFLVIPRTFLVKQ
jgi:hypothetical protein